MEWVETTGKTLEEAKERALDRLGIGPADAEFQVLDEPLTGLFGRLRREARVRARVKPATVRPKQERRRPKRAESRPPRPTVKQGGPAASNATPSSKESPMSDDPHPADSVGSGDPEPTEDVDVGAVARAAEQFAAGLLDAFGLHGEATSTTEGHEIDVHIEAQGDGLGLLIGPGGRTLLAIQDLARVAAQRRLGDHQTRLRIDIAGYREKRRVALERFSHHVAELVKTSGVARSLDPMPSADRKVVHDTLATIDGVATRSEGEDPYRRIIVTPVAPAPPAG